MYFLAQLRPQFIEATQAAAWNHWFLIAYALPFLIVIPFSYFRWGGCFVAPIAFIASWFVYAFAIHVYDKSFELNAVTESEWGAVTADTGRTFAPFFHGTPKTFFATAIACIVGFPIGGWIRNARRRNGEYNAMLEQSPQSRPVYDNPYEPPR